MVIHIGAAALFLFKLFIDVVIAAGFFEISLALSYPNIYKTQFVLTGLFFAFLLTVTFTDYIKIVW